MVGVPEILTTKIVAEICWKGIKEGVSITKEYLRESLKDWVLSDSEREILAASIQALPDQGKSSELFLAAYLDTNATIKEILKNAKLANTFINITQAHNGIGDNVGRDKVVGK